MLQRMCIRALLCAPLIALAAPTAVRADDIEKTKDQKETQIPVCTHSLGTVAVYEPESTAPGQEPWWTKLQLESPEALLKVFVNRSHCFTLVDRGKGFAALEQERAIASGGQLRRGSNIGLGQIKAADYILVPDIASKNEDSGGSALFGIIGAFIPGIGGAVLSGLKQTDRTVDVVLTLTDVRSSQQVALEEGHGAKTDISFGGGGGLVGGGGFGAVGAGSYEHTEIGQVIMLAYIDAYTKLVTELGGLPSDASAASAPQAVSMVRPGSLYASPSVSSKVVRHLAAGATLYPTGEKDGVWWEARDEVGTTGWVSSLLVENAK